MSAKEEATLKEIERILKKSRSVKHNRELFWSLARFFAHITIIGITYLVLAYNCDCFN